MNLLGEFKLEPKTIAKDFLAGIIVFLVALPLCLGIAIASDADPIAGLISGIVGGIVIGLMRVHPTTKRNWRAAVDCRMFSNKSLCRSTSNKRAHFQTCRHRQNRQQWIKLLDVTLLGWRGS